MRPSCFRVRIVTRWILPSRRASEEEGPVALAAHMGTLGDRPEKLFSLATMESVVVLGPFTNEMKEALAPFNPTFYEDHCAGFTR